MRDIDALASYLPSLIVQDLQGRADVNSDDRAAAEHLDAIDIVPGVATRSFRTVCLFADIAGFTALSEAFLSKGFRGVEDLAFHLNSYTTQIVRLISKVGVCDVVVVSCLFTAPSPLTPPNRPEETSSNLQAMRP